VKRTCCLIVDNMCKLVEDPAEILPLMAKLEPLGKVSRREDFGPRGTWHGREGLQDAAKSCR